MSWDKLPEKGKAKFRNIWTGMESKKETLELIRKQKVILGTYVSFFVGNTVKLYIGEKKEKQSSKDKACEESLHCLDLRVSLPLFIST